MTTIDNDEKGGDNDTGNDDGDDTGGNNDDHCPVSM